VAGITGVPIVTEHALSILETKVISEMDLGTHTVFVADTLRSQTLREGVPLTYRYYQLELKGKSPAAAPTYQGGKTGK
ncbi:MAG TPA: flavin reductase family protein, partial [Thermodesulfobacteriota bacterium]|nr:flavin reductase family protein [Thermodesulfobacteriota bacterium]